MTGIGLYLLRKMTASFARILINDLTDDDFDVESSIEAEVFDYAPGGRHVTAGQLAHLYLLVGRARVQVVTPQLFVSNSETLAWITPDKRLVTLYDDQYRFTSLKELVQTLNRHECDRLIFRLKGDHDRLIRSYVYELQELRRVQAAL